MQELRVRLETVTPLFLGGEEPRQDPELRASSFRGALRYWLRAALAGAVGDDDRGVQKVWAAESAVFGSAGEGQSGIGDKRAGASAVVVRVRGQMPDPLPYQKSNPGWDPITRRPIPSGRDYLFWSMAKTSADAARSYWPPGTSFELALAARPGAADGEAALDQAIAALWLLVHLGGIGARSRRTGGSMGVPNAVEANGLRFALAGTTPGALAGELREGLGQVRSLFRALGNQAPAAVPSEFDVLHPRCCRVWVLGLWPSTNQAMEEIGTALQRFRGPRGRGPQDRVRRRESGIGLLERAVFGLPIKGVDAKEGGSQVDRRASPLWLKVSKTVKGNYAGIATLFSSRFLPERAFLQASGRRADPPADYGLLEGFVREYFAAAQEVRYE